MPHAQALVPTRDPSTPAADLARAFAAAGETQWSAEAGFVRSPAGVCHMHAWPEGLRLDAFAETSDDLAEVESSVAARLRDAGLVVEWTRRPLSL